jgi:hypothetical protein
VDRTVGDVQDLIMLGVLSAQSADESTAFAPGDPHRLHVATLPRWRELTPEEPPTLPVHPAPAVPPPARRARMLAQRRNVFGVRASQLPDPEGQDERDRAPQIPGISVLDEFLELVPKRRWDLDRGRKGLHPAANERPHRVRPRREFVVRSEPLE